MDGLVEQFKGGWPFVESLVTSRREETLHLDFKRKSNPRNPGMDRPDRENLSAALSGFANSDGGLLVWGIDAHKVDGIDRVQGIVPIEQLARFTSELKTVTPDMASGPLPDVEHLPILAPGKADEGIVVTVVPRSDMTPHMATGPEMHRYYRRTVDRFQHMEHHEVADMFGRRPQPDLRLEIPWEMHFVGATEAHILVHFMVSNRGRGIARFPCLTIGHPPKSWPFFRVSGSGEVGGPFQTANAPHGWHLRYQGLSDGVIYPRDEFKVATIEFAIGDLRQKGGMTLIAEVVAEGTALVHVERVVSLVDMMYAGDQLTRTGQTYLSEDHPGRRPQPQ
ncbi:MAG: ATP-binding protein [Gemmatimonadales bacterium]